MQNLHGHSLLPVLNDAGAPDAYGGVLHFEWRGGWAVRVDEWKLIGGTCWRSEERGLTLHRLTDEQPEVKDYAAKKPEVVARLRAMHEKWLAGVTP